MADPYRVWLSEIMLQQTTVAAVIPYFLRFTQRFPDLQALAMAPEDEVFALWAGLGYYARARNLMAAARAVADAGGFPETEMGLRGLPGIGPYTAAAIAALAFGVAALPVDGNVERVLARYFRVDAPLPGAKPVILAHAATLAGEATFRGRPGDGVQALFDLGATLCAPGRPACALCPLAGGCAARRAGVAAELPRKAARPPRPQRFGAQFWLVDAADQVLLRRRPARGLFGGMVELPGTPWREAPFSAAEAVALAPMAAGWRQAGEVRHVFTHFALTLDVHTARVGQITAPGFLRPLGALDAEALPSVMRKCVRLARGAAP